MLKFSHLNMYMQQQTDLLSTNVSQRQYDVEEVMNTPKIHIHCYIISHYKSFYKTAQYNNFTHTPHFIYRVQEVSILSIFIRQLLI
jgi:hypothetical protein